MTADQNLDRALSAWLDSETTSVPEDLLARSLARVGGTRQRPAWLVAEGVVLPARHDRVTFVPLWALVVMGLLAAALVAVGATGLLPSPTALIEPSPTPFAQVPPTSAPTAVATALATPSATPGPLGGRLILAQSFERGKIAPIDVFLLDAATGERTELGTVVGPAFDYQEPSRLGFIRGGTNVVVVEGLDVEGQPARIEHLTQAGRAMDFRYVEDLTAACCGDGNLEFLALSPQEDRIAGLHADGFDDAPIEVIVEGLDGSNVVRLTPPIAPLSWAPDGSAVLGPGCRPCNKADSPLGRQTEHREHLYIIPLDGSPPRELLDVENGGWSARFSPDGSTIFAGLSHCAPGSFMPRCDPSEDTGSVGIVDIATGQYSKLRDADGGQWIGWSPDGTRVAYEANDGLIVMRPDGSDVIHVQAPLYRQFQWSPDGQWLMYDDGDYELWITPADGSGPPRQIGTHLFGAAW